MEEEEQEQETPIPKPPPPQAQSQIQIQASSSQPLTQVPFTIPGKVTKTKKKPASAYQILCKERQEKECFTCEKKGCTSCRRTPEEIFQTRQTLWAKALQEEANLKKKIQAQEDLLLSQGSQSGL